MGDQESEVQSLEGLRVMRLWEELSRHSLSPARAKEFQSRVYAKELTRFTDDELRQSASRARATSDGRLLLARWFHETSAMKFSVVMNSDWEDRLWAQEAEDEQAATEWSSLLESNRDWDSRNESTDRGLDPYVEDADESREAVEDHHANLDSFGLLMRRDDIEHLGATIDRVGGASADA